MTEKLTQTLKHVEETVEKAPKLLAQFTQVNSQPSPNESDVEQIIQTAKTRIQQLEEEGEQLEKLFSNYLERQQDRKQDIEMNRVQIWQRYQRDREKLLNAAATTITRDLPETLTTFTQFSTHKISDKGSDSLPIIECAHKNMEIENPFKKFDVTTYLQKAHEKRILERPKIERLEAFRRLDREVETFKNRMLTRYPTGTSLTSRSIFGPPEYSTTSNLKEISTATEELQKKIESENVIKPSSGVPVIQVQDAETMPGTATTVKIIHQEEPVQITRTETKPAEKLKFDSQPTLAKSDKSSFLTKSEVLDLNEVSFDIELSKTKSSSSVSLIIIDENKTAFKADQTSLGLEKHKQAPETSTSDNKSTAVRPSSTRVLKPDELQVHHLPQKPDPTPESSLNEDIEEEVDIHLKNIDEQISEIDEKIQSLADEESADIDKELKKLDEVERTEPKFVSLKSLNDRKLESPGLVSGLLGRFDRPAFSASDTKMTTLQMNPTTRDLQTSFEPVSRTKTDEKQPDFMSTERPRIEEISKYFTKLDGTARNFTSPPPQVIVEKRDQVQPPQLKLFAQKPAESVNSSKNGSKSDKEDLSKKSIGIDLTLSSEDSEKIVISTGKQSQSENSDDFWKLDN